MKRDYPVIDMAGTGLRIKSIMQQNGLTVKDIQKYLGLSTPQSIYHWFDGRNLPTIDNLYALSVLFQLPIDSMLVGNRECEWRDQSDLQKRVYLYHVMLKEVQAA